MEDKVVILRDEIRLVALELEGWGYGTFSLPHQNWRQFSGINSICGIETRPLQPARIWNATELAALIIRRSQAAKGDAPYLPVDLRDWHPEIGEDVMALGFADLDVDHEQLGTDRPITQRLYGSLAKITEVQRSDGRSSRPWPCFRVEANWPGGMSGGPVFNRHGNVIGIVSTGIVGEAIGTAIYFSGWDFPKRTFTTLDASNPGWFHCWGAFNHAKQIVGIARTREELELQVPAGGPREIFPVTIELRSGEYVLR